ncbi:MAG: type IV pilus biogenesis/stability protein PilW [Betaproteobacteria bacterium]|jgi:type IV pilus assembly protein PilF|nr:type IV pilus biogenesis/stability protein PilW [Betaproteobacteria bacterium]NBS48146.1 type IV pilus biogenesis/stability protein PilW [Betaproteobacteria bacterium]
MKRAVLACMLAWSAACSVHAWNSAADSDKSRAARIRTELAVGYLEQGQLAVAQQELQQALQADPQFAQAHHAMALLQMRLGDVTRARESFDRALSLAPRDPDILHNHGWLLCQQGEHARAVQAFAQSLADPLYTQRARTLLAQGVCQLHAGDAEAAQASLSRALALDPTHPLTRYHLAQALLRRGDLSGARAQTQSLNDSVFANAQTLWLGIRVERRSRNPEAAARLAQRLEREHPQSQEFAAWQRGADDE